MSPLRAQHPTLGIRPSELPPVQSRRCRLFRGRGHRGYLGLCRPRNLCFTQLWLGTQAPQVPRVLIKLYSRGCRGPWRLTPDLRAEAEAWEGRKPSLGQSASLGGARAGAQILSGQLPAVSIWNHGHFLGSARLRGHAVGTASDGGRSAPPPASPEARAGVGKLEGKFRGRSKDPGAGIYQGSSTWGVLSS